MFLQTDLGHGYLVQPRSLYARVGVAEYWIVNLLDRRLEVYRDPARQPEARYGWGYRDVRSYGPGDWISPQAAPPATVQVADLLP